MLLLFVQVVNQQVKRPQMMTEVTGKFVLKCRTTNIATLFDISLFYVYKFYFISNLIGISRILLPSPWGRGKGEGLLVMCYFLFFIHHFTAAFIISFMPSKISSRLLCLNSPLPSPPACFRIKVLSSREQPQSERLLTIFRSSSKRSGVVCMT